MNHNYYIGKAFYMHKLISIAHCKAKICLLPADDAKFFWKRNEIPWKENFTPRCHAEFRGARLSRECRVFCVGMERVSVRSVRAQAGSGIANNVRVYAMLRSNMGEAVLAPAEPYMSC